MFSALARFVLVISLIAGLIPSAMAQESAPQTPEEAAERRIGFYFGLRLAKLSFPEPADDIATIIAAPPRPGLPFDPSGARVDVDFRSRVNLEFFVGFRLRKKGSVEATFMQWDEREDLFQDAEPGKAFANRLASPLAGIHEDLDGDGDALGIEGGATAENDGRGVDPFLDGAEDINFTGAAEFLKFETSTRIRGLAATDFQAFDVDYRRTLKETRRFSLDWRAGVRIASLDQSYDIAYQQPGSFAVFIDEEPDIPVAEYTGCPGGNAPIQTASNNQDGDGDGDPLSFLERDGDGFLNGNCNATVSDVLTSVATLSEDRIVANIKTSGYGIKAGLDARMDLSKKWRITGSAGISALQTTTEFSYRETFVSERDRYLNFIEWDFNGDGVYDNFDLDFDGSCDRTAPAVSCRITAADSDAYGASRPIFFRDGIENSVTATPQGLNRNAYRGANQGILRVGDPIGESERNTDILRESMVLTDVSGETKGIKPVLDLQVGLEWQFSRFAHLGFGVRSSTWFDAGKFRSIADDIAAARTPEADGDFTLVGGFVTLTVVPR